jgi:exodeoxyribonuclease VII large subunit
VWKTGHLYFTLKDGGAQIHAVMYRSALRYLRFKAEDGLRIIARGRVSVYEPKGEYQLVCEHIEPHGLGALQLAFEQLKRRLQAEGVFDAARKRPLPLLPRRIGIVTSLDGAAIRDIAKVLNRRYPNVHVVVRPARVQGEGAGADLARALAQIVRVPRIDVVIIGRGGGSAEDLWAFNDEVLARAIAASPVPVISAVGHEIDYTISDLVADLRAPTPSAAAELVVARKDEFIHRIDRLTERVRSAFRSQLERLRARVHGLERRPALAGWQARLVLRGRRATELTHELAHAMRSAMGTRERRLHGLRLQLESHDLRRRLAAVRTQSTTLATRLDAAIAQRHLRLEARLRSAVGRLETLSPLGVLARGYAVCWNRDRTEIIRTAAAVRVGDTVRISLHRGELTCDVSATEE